MKVIFLDVDGVLVHSETVGRGRGERPVFRKIAQVDMRCMERLKEAIDATGAEVVLVSTWRLTQSGRTAMKAVGRKLGLPRHWVSNFTDHMPMGEYPRANEISAWLEGVPDEIEAYVWVDDSVNQGDHGHPTVHVAHGWSLGGLRDSHVNEIKEILGCE